MAGTVAAYVSVGTEPDTRGLVYALWKRGTYVLLPLLRAGLRPGLGVVRGAGLAGPRAARAAPADRAAAGRERGDQRRPGDRAGARGGPRRPQARPGRGSYDRALARVGPAVPTVALIYDDELLDEVPAGPLDQRVRLVARPRQGIIRLR